MGFESEGGSGGGSSTGTAVDPISILYADILAGVSANTLAEGFYLITNSTAADGGVLVQVYKDSQDVLRVRHEAEGVYFNPDFQDVGIYTGISGASTRRGVWHSGLAGLAIGHIVIWNNLHYKNLTGAVGTSPSGDAVNWQLFNKSTTPLTRGYVAESNTIIYNFSADELVRRLDSRGNDVPVGTVSTFQFGNDSCTDWVVDTYSQVDNRNSRGESYAIKCTSYARLFQSNAHEGTFKFSEVTGTFDGATPPGLITINLNSGITISGVTIETSEAITFAAAVDELKVSAISGDFSNFRKEYTITGLTTMTFGATFNYIGIVDLVSTNTSEAIDLFANFPANHPVRFFPESGLVVTFSNGSGSNQPRCEGGINAVIDGTNGEWIEFTKQSDGFIYQTGIFINQAISAAKLFNYNNFS